MIALPCDAEANAVPQVVKVYDSQKAVGPSLVPQGTSEPSQAN